VSFSWAPYANFRDRPFERGHEPVVQLAAVSPTYFETMQIPVRRGRVFGPQDRAGATMAVIVNETVVRRFLPPGDPIGRHLSIVGVPELEDAEIVGVVGDTLRGSLAGRVTSEVYCAYSQFPASHPTLVVRAAAGDPLQLLRIVESQLAGVDRAVASYGARRLSDAIASTVGDRRLLSGLLSMFAGLALVLTALGIGGVVSFVAAQRTQEIAVRIALGAKPGAVIRTVVGSAVTPVVAGLAIGLGAALPLTRLIQRFLFQVDPWDPMSLGAGAMVMLAAALAAAYVPARRASRVDPLTALRAQ
jgi:putative ABC transport system permease protein